MSNIVIAQDKGHNTEDTTYINIAEAGDAKTLTGSITLPDGMQFGDTMAVIVDGQGQEYTIGDADLKSGKIDLFAWQNKLMNVEDGGKHTVELYIGSEHQTMNIVMDLTAPQAPTVHIQDDNGVIGIEEAEAGVKVTVTPQSDAKLGDALSVDTDGDGTYDLTETITQDILDNGLEVTIAKADLTDGENMSVNAIVTDIAGNPGKVGENDTTVKVDLTPPNDGAAPTVEIQDGDNVINIEESQEATIDVKVSFDATKVSEGDTVKVTFLGQTETVKVPSADASEVTATFNMISLTDATKYEATAVIIEAGSGNVSKEGTDTTTTDLSIATTAPKVTILDGGDNLLTAAELDNTISVEIKIPDDAKAGDTLNIYAGNSDTPYSTITLSAGDIGSTITVVADQTYIDSMKDQDNQEIKISADVTDAANNASPKGEDTSLIDLTAPNGGEAPTVELMDDRDNDGDINKEEFDKDGNGKIDVQVSFDSDKVDEGDVVHIKNNNGETADVTIDATSIANGYVTTTFTPPADNTKIIVNASIEDKAGNVSKEGEDIAIFDTSDITSGTEAVISTDDNNDTFINIQELQDDGNKILVTVTLPDNTRAGDKLVVDGTSNDPQDIVLTAEQVTAGQVVVTFDNVPANGVLFETTAQVKDAVGNASNIATDSATISKDSPTAPTVTIVDDADHDGYISDTEKDGEINVDIKLPDGTVPGSTLTVTDDDDNTHTITITDEDITNGTVSVTFPQPTDGETIEVTATITDPSGNPSDPGTATATMDFTQFEGLAIKITTDADDSGIINAAELTADNNQINVEVTIPKGAAVGDTIKVTASGNTEENIVLTQEQIGNGKIELTFDSPVSGSDFVATASISDEAGNAAGPVDDKAKIDTDAPADATVTILDGGDGYINAVELADNGGTISATVTLGATTMAGDTLKVTDNGTPLDDILLTQDDIDAGSVRIDNLQNPGDGETLTVTAQVVDAGGNPSAVTEDSTIIDTSAPTIEITEPIAGDNIINAAEQPAVTINGTTKGVEDGQEVTLTITGSKGGVITETATVTDNAWNVADIDMSNLKEGSLDIKAEVTDKAGNKAEDKADGDVKIEANIEIDADSAKVTVDEDGLLSDTDNSEDASNTLSGKNIGDDASFTLAPTTTDSGLTSDGVKVEWQDNSANPHELIGTANGEEVLKVTINDKGEYEVNLSKAVDHPDTTTEDVIDSTVNVHVVNNVSGNAIDTNITINIGDDVPSTSDSQGTTQNLDLSAVNTNLGIILDVSPSMVDASTGVYKADGSEYTRMELAVQSIDNLIDNYERFGDVAVKLTIFSTSATNPTNVWLNANDAKTMIDEIASIAKNYGYADGSTSNAYLGGTTNYDAALAEYLDTYSTQTDGKLESAQEVTYFLTDGRPNSSDGDDSALLNNPTTSFHYDTSGINGTEETIWTDYLKENGITAISLGMGSNLRSPETLNPIAYNGKTGEEADGIVVTDLSQLNTVVQSTVVIPSLDGNLLENTTFGADGEGSLAVTINGITYTYNAETKQISNDANGDVVDGVSLTAPTATGSSITIDMTTGAYTYQANEAVATAKDIVTENIKFVATDGDGDSLTSELTLNIKPAESDAVFAPKLSLTVEGGDDDVIDADEAGELSVSGTTDAGEGQTVTITVKGDGEDVTVQATVDASGKYEAKVDVSSFKDGDLNISAAVQNAGGKETTKVEALTLDTSVKAPDAPAELVVNADANNDGSISQEEIDAGIKATVTLADSAKAGETLHVTFNGEDVETVLTDENIAKGSVEVAMPDSVTLANGDNLEVSAKMSNGDVASEVVTATAIPVSIAVTAPEKPDGLSIVADADKDGVISQDEIDAGVKAVVDLADDAKAGDILNVSFNGGEKVETVLTQENIDNGTVEVAMPASTTLTDGQPITVAATMTSGDQTSESMSLSTRATVDTNTTPTPEAPSAPTGIEVVADANNDGKISKEEIDAGVKANVSLADDAKVGDTVNVSFNGQNAEPVVLTQENIDNGSVEVAMPAATTLTDGQPISVEATVTSGDKTSQPATTQTTATVDTDTTPATLPTPVEFFTNSDTDHDGKLSQSELDAGVKVGVQVSNTTEVGDTLNVSFNGTVEKVEITQENVDGKAIFVELPDAVATALADGDTLELSATVSNAKGETSEAATLSLPIDLDTTTQPEVPSAPEGIEVLADVNSDGTFNQADIDAGVKANVSLADDAKVGDTLNVTFNGEKVETVLTQENIDKGSVEVAMPAATPVEDGKPVQVEATVTNANGTSEAAVSQTANLDLSTTPEPTKDFIEIAGDDDGVLDANEFTPGDSVEVTVNIGDTAKAGDLLLIAVDGTYQPVVVVTQEQADAGKVTIDSTAVNNNSSLDVRVRVYTINEEGIIRTGDESKEVTIDTTPISTDNTGKTTDTTDTDDSASTGTDTGKTDDTKDTTDTTDTGDKTEETTTGDSDIIASDTTVHVHGTADADSVDSIKITLKDTEGNVTETTAKVNEDGTWELDADVSKLAKGDVSMTTTSLDKDNKELVNTVSTLVLAAAVTQAVAIESPISVDADDNTVSVTGTTKNVDAGTEVSVQIDDVDNDATAPVNTTAIVNTDGSWAAEDVDVSSLDSKDGLHVEASIGKAEESTEPTAAAPADEQQGADASVVAEQPSVYEGTDGDDEIAFDLSKNIDGKEGNDTLIVATPDANETIDLTKVEDLDAKIENVEAIKMNGSEDAHTELVIDTDAILDMTDNADVIFKVEGNKGDSIKDATTGQFTILEDQNGVDEGYIRYQGLDSDGQNIRIDVQDTVTVDF